MRSRRVYRSRCYVCKTVLNRMVCSFHQWNVSQGWHTVFPLCTTCWAAIHKIVVKAEAEYQ